MAYGGSGISEPAPTVRRGRSPSPTAGRPAHSDPGEMGAVGREHQRGRHHHGRSRSSMRFSDLEKKNGSKPRKSKPLFQRTNSVNHISLNAKLQLSMINSGLMKIPKAEENRAIAALTTKPVEVKDFIPYSTQRKKYPVLLKVEFQTASRVEFHSTRHGSKAANEVKNQNPKIIPYDYNRVVLDPLPNEPDSDYVNASYIDSLVNPKAYIVAQGPTENTIGDFWRMVWQANVKCIVMLTKTFDFIKVMCVQYWPAANHMEEIYDGVGVTIMAEEQLAHFMMRTVRLRKPDLANEKERERTVMQFHYTEWPCHSPPFSSSLLEFRRRVRVHLENLPPESPLTGPVLVHCNDGAGRSGVFLAIDANIESAEEDGTFSVYPYLKRLKSARRGLVENIEQYRFVYEALEEFVMCGMTWFPVSELSTRLKSKSLKDPVTKMNEYQLEYSKISKMTPKFTIGDCAGGHRPENREKNRDVIIVPPDNYRPYLTSFQGNTCTDYINAVFVDGYIRPKEYVVTEWPMNTSVSDFWSLVYDHDANTIVVICNPTNHLTYPPFWPESKQKKFGAVFTVETLARKEHQNIKSWIVRINKKVGGVRSRALAGLLLSWVARRYSNGIPR